MSLPDYIFYIPHKEIIGYFRSCQYQRTDFSTGTTYSVDIHEKGEPGEVYLEERRKILPIVTSLQPGHIVIYAIDPLQPEVEGNAVGLKVPVEGGTTFLFMGDGTVGVLPVRENVIVRRKISGVYEILPHNIELQYKPEELLEHVVLLDNEDVVVTESRPETAFRIETPNPDGTGKFINRRGGVSVALCGFEVERLTKEEQDIFRELFAQQQG